MHSRRCTINHDCAGLVDTDILMMIRVPNAASLLILLVSCVALAPSVLSLSFPEATGQTGVERSTWIERTSPGVFGDSDRPGLAEVGVRYQVNATVLIPLLITSIPIINRNDVGVASFVVSDFEDDTDHLLRAFEFFAASIPEQARGLNRLGFIREVASLDVGGPEWSAQFGVISADRAQSGSRDEAEQTFEQDQNVQPYKVIDAMIGRERSVGTVTTLVLEGNWRSAGELYSDVRPRWAEQHADFTREIENRDGAYDLPIGFLGAIQRSLRKIASELSAGIEPRPFSTAYVHKGQVFQMELRDHRVDRRRKRAYEQAGLVAPDAVVHKLDYRVLNDKGHEDESFELWAELPTQDPENPRGSPILPLAFEFKPRAYLELKAVQIPEAR
jgi:hypothetical protein